MGKKILKCVVLLGALGLLVYIILLLTDIFKINLRGAGTDKKARMAFTYEIPATKDPYKLKIDSIVNINSRNYFNLQTSQKLYDSLTFSYENGGGFGNDVMFVINMLSASRWRNYRNPSNWKQRSFIKLPWLTLKEISDSNGIPFFPLEAYSYYVKDGKTYISREILDSSSGNKGIKNTPYVDAGFFVQLEGKKLEDRIGNYKDFNLYIPLDNKSKYRFFYYLNMSYTLFSLLLILFLIWKSGSILLAISNNKAFEWKNVKRLKQCVWALMIMIILPYVLMFGLYLGFYKTLHDYVQIKSWIDIIHWKTWTTLFIYFALFLAFNRGYKLQSDQEYTI